MPVVTSGSRIVIERGVDIAPDIQREVQTYKITLDNVNKVLSELKTFKIGNERPHDYLAEMYKSDTHMTKIRKHLAEREANIKESTLWMYVRYAK
jgi:rRNA-processing protein EBP2